MYLYDFVFAERTSLRHTRHGQRCTLIITISRGGYDNDGHHHGVEEELDVPPPFFN